MARADIEIQLTEGISQELAKLSQQVKEAQLVLSEARIRGRASQMGKATGTNRSFWDASEL